MRRWNSRKNIIICIVFGLDVKSVNLIVLWGMEFKIIVLHNFLFINKFSYHGSVIIILFNIMHYYDINNFKGKNS